MSPPPRTIVLSFVFTTSNHLYRWASLPNSIIVVSPLSFLGLCFHSAPPFSCSFCISRRVRQRWFRHVRLRCKELDKIVKGVEERHLCIPVAINRMKGVKERCFFVAVVMNRERGGGDAVLQLRCNGRQWKVWGNKFFFLNGKWVMGDP